MTTAESQCYWNAWYNNMPGSSPTLYVTGKCTFPTGGYSVKLERAEVGIEPLGVLQLRYIVEPSKDADPTVITVEEVRYSKDTDAVYTEVQILPDNIKIPVEQVSRTTPLKGGILVTFDVAGEQFKVWITNPNTIEQVKDLQAGKSNANIPIGTIHRGSGEGNHNAPYNWHLDPQDIGMAENTIELCDALPSYVEANVDEFVDNVTRFCPWSTKLVNVEDLRENLEGVTIMEPNLFELQGDNTKLTYSISSFTGEPQFTFSNQSETRTFSGSDIQVEDTATGRIVTVMLRTNEDDGGFESLTLLLPVVQLSPEFSNVAIKTLAIHSRRLVRVAPGATQLQTYNSLNLSGTAQIVEFR